MKTKTEKKTKLQFSDLIAVLTNFGITHVVVDTGEILDIVTTPGKEEPPWVLDVACGVMFGRNIILFDQIDRPVGMLYPELFDGMEQYVFESCGCINSNRKKK